MKTAILAEGLSKRFGDVQALSGLDLAVARGGGAGVPGTERSGQDDHDPAAAGMLRPTSGRERLAAARVTQLLSREPSLEELFLAQHGAEAAPAGREVALDVR